MKNPIKLIQQLTGKQTTMPLQQGAELSVSESFLRSNAMIGMHRPELVAYYMDEEVHHFASIVWQPDDMPTEGHESGYLVYLGTNIIPYDRDAWMTGGTFQQVLDVLYDDLHLTERDFRKATASDYERLYR